MLLSLPFKHNLGRQVLTLSLSVRYSKLAGLFFTPVSLMTPITLMTLINSHCLSLSIEAS